jgi:uncharacterized protein (DUF4415 family)
MNRIPMHKTLTVHDLLKPVKGWPIPKRPQRAREEPPAYDMVRIQIEIPQKVFQHFRDDGRGWQKRIARALERAAEGSA